MRPTQIVVAALLCALGLTGCGDNPKPSSLPSRTPTTTSSPSSTASPPPLPAAARGTTPASAEAFVGHYLAVFSYAASSGDVEALRQLGRSSCESCKGVAARIQDTYSHGGHATGRGYVGRSPSAKRTADGMRVTVRIVAFEQRIYASTNASPRVVPRSQSGAVFDLAVSGTGWIVADWTRT